MLIKFVLGRIGQDKLCGLQAACVVIHARQTGRKTCKRPVNSEQTGFRGGLFVQARFLFGVGKNIQIAHHVFHIGCAAIAHFPFPMAVTGFERKRETVAVKTCAFE